MIKLIVGGIGSGKSLSAVKDIIDSEKTTYTNFNINSKKAIRLKTEHIIKKELRDSTAKKETYDYKVNWEYWNKVKNTGFNITIDEVHNVLHSRRSMTKWNTLFSMWLAQIRKILGESERYNLTLITQKVDRVDVSARDLAQEVIYVRKKMTFDSLKTVVYNSAENKYYVKRLPTTYILKYHFKGTYALEKFYKYLEGVDDMFDYSTYFLANPYYQYYDSYEILNFGEEIYV